MKLFRSFKERVKNYVYDTSVSIKDRTFVIFSMLMLLALLAAVPCGLIMHEPISATLSTLAGFILFSLYVIYAFLNDRIEQAKDVISVVVVFIFLPVMFFTNGGAYGGAPVWLLLGTIYISLILEGKRKKIMLFLNSAIIIACWIIGYFNPRFVSEYSRGGNYFDSIAAMIIVGSIIYSLITFQLSLFKKDEHINNLKRLFEQTSTALVNAIDAKDEYTHGHSSRVAEYSRKIAEMYGKSPVECDEIYYIALLHDVGKIGISEKIINKDGKLTDDEYEEIKKHPVFGAQILRVITEYPDLYIGARFHHERYDGKGYPEGLKGEDIPEVARIISVADAYDAMTSKRSYRDTIPQQLVREEIVKGAGTQFDPKFAKIMQHLIDNDTEYDLKEKIGIAELRGKNEISSETCLDEISEGILVGPDPKIKTICFKYEPKNRKKGSSFGQIVLFDSLDGRHHSTPRMKNKLNYFEYAVIRFDGQFECYGARKIESKEEKRENTGGAAGNDAGIPYEIEAVRVKDHMLIKIGDPERVVTLTIALPDSSRYSYIGLTGENCHLYDVSISTSENTVPGDYIPRIAEEISYIKGPEGDLPNIQIDGYRRASTKGVLLKDGMEISFHTMSLPTARLVWHTAYVDIFYSPDRMPEGEGYMEYAFIRLDGENWEAEELADNKTIVNRNDDFEGWDTWKEANKKGFDCTVHFSVEGNKIITTTQNQGISLRNVTTILVEPPELYVSLTGDQCAITNIRIKS